MVYETEDILLGLFVNLVLVFILLPSPITNLFWSSRRKITVSSCLQNVAPVDFRPVCLETLLTELILSIVEILPPSSVLALTYTCKTFYRSCDFPLQDTLGPRRLAVNRDMIRSERLKLLCMLARDRKFPQGRLVCSACTTTHDSGLFRCTAHYVPSSKRKCRGSEGRMWICPYKILDYEQIKAIKEHFRRPPRARSNNLEIPAILERCKDPDHYVSITSNQVRQWRPIIYINNETPLCEQNIVAALGSLNTSICPHLRVTDRIVQSLSSRLRENLARGSGVFMHTGRNVTSATQMCLLRYFDKLRAQGNLLARV